MLKYLQQKYFQIAKVEKYRYLNYGDINQKQDEIISKAKK